MRYRRESLTGAWVVAPVQQWWLSLQCSEKRRGGWMKNYKTPTITDLGSVAGLTRGSDPEELGDGASFRGPPDTDPDPSS